MNSVPDRASGLQQGIHFLQSTTISADLDLATAALALTALCRANIASLKQLQASLAEHLLTHRLPGWEFTPHAAHVSERDMIATWHALYALHSYNPQLIDEAALAHVVKLLVAHEYEVGGPYRTTADETAPNIAVNAVIAAFVQEVSQPLPTLTKLIHRAIRRRQFGIVPMRTIYCLTLGLGNTFAPGLARYVERNAPKTDNLAIAHAAAAYQNIYARPSRILQSRLLAFQATDGAWHIAGDSGSSTLLATALAVQALSIPPLSVDQEPIPQPTPSRATSLYEQVFTEARVFLCTLTPPLRTYALDMLKLIRSADTNREIALLPYFFAESLRQPATIPTRIFTQLGLANLYAWVAYTIYDDFLDDEGDPRMLSVANVALRASYTHFNEAIPHNVPFHASIEQAFTLIDQANAWEVTHCRYPITNKALHIGKPPPYGNLSKLAHRAFSHTLPPVGILAYIGTAPDSMQGRALQLAFTHYLIARQLNDDMHDWEEDVQAGHISPVVHVILHGLALTGTQPFDTLLPRMRQQFWRHSLVRLCAEVKQHTACARQAAHECDILAPDNIIERLMNDIDKVIDSTLSDWERGIMFLGAYKG